MRTWRPMITDYRRRITLTNVRDHEGPTRAGQVRVLRRLPDCPVGVHLEPGDPAGVVSRDAPAGCHCADNDEAASAVVGASLRCPGATLVIDLHAKHSGAADGGPDGQFTAGLPGLAVLDRVAGQLGDAQDGVLCRGQAGEGASDEPTCVSNLLGPGGEYPVCRRHCFLLSATPGMGVRMRVRTWKAVRCGERGARPGD